MLLCVEGISTTPLDTERHDKWKKELYENGPGFHLIEDKVLVEELKNNLPNENFDYGWNLNQAALELSKVIKNSDLNKYYYIDNSSYSIYIKQKDNNSDNINYIARLVVLNDLKYLASSDICAFTFLLVKSHVNYKYFEDIWEKGDGRILSNRL